MRRGNAFKFLGGLIPDMDDRRSLRGRVIRDGSKDTYNKSFMLEFREREIDRCLLHQRPLSVLMMDISFLNRPVACTGISLVVRYSASLQITFHRCWMPMTIYSGYGGKGFEVVVC